MSVCVCVLVVFVTSVDGWLGESLGDLALHQSCIFIFLFFGKAKIKSRDVTITPGPPLLLAALQYVKY